MVEPGAIKMVSVSDWGYLAAISTKLYVYLLTSDIKIKAKNRKIKD